MQLIIISLCFLFTRNQKHRLVNNFFRDFLEPFEKYEMNMKYSFFFIVNYYCIIQPRELRDQHCPTAMNPEL